MSNPEATDAVRPADEWHEDHGPVLWWTLDEWGAIAEAPIVARGDEELDEAQPWPGYYTHWSPLPVMPQYPVREMKLAPHGTLICDYRMETLVSDQRIAVDGAYTEAAKQRYLAMLEDIRHGRV